MYRLGVEWANCNREFTTCEESESDQPSPTDCYMRASELGNFPTTFLLLILSCSYLYINRIKWNYWLVISNNWWIYSVYIQRWLISGIHCTIECLHSDYSGPPNTWSRDVIPARATTSFLS